MPKCEHCGKEVLLPFECNYCGKKFCIEHRLPENHECPNLPARTPLGPWYAKKTSIPKKEEIKELIPEQEKPKKKVASEGELYFIKEKSHKWKSTPLRGKKMLVRLPKIMIAGLLLVIILFFEYFFVKTYFGTTFYVFVVFVASYLTYKLFILSSKIRLGSDLRLFGLRLLAGLTFVVGVLLVAGAFMEYAMSYEQWDNQLYMGVLLFSGTLGLGLILLASYLIFRFMLKSGVIVYPR